MERWRRPIAGMLIVVMLIQTTGCTAWKTVSLQVAASESPKKKVQVVLKAGGTVTTDSVRTRGDTVLTYQPGGTGAVTVDKVAAVKVRRSSTAKTAALALGIGAALFAAFIAMVIQANKS